VNESIDYDPNELLNAPPEGADPQKYLALYSLPSLLWGQKEQAGSRKIYHVLKFKEPRGKQMAFIVDEFSSIEEAIVQSVDSFIAALPGIQGATVRKDGSVALMLNTESIVEHALKARPFAFVKVKEKQEKEEVTLTDFLGFSA
jgi:chemotaxis protein histidine kinase CheA